MDAQALYALRDVAGVPSHPVLFLVLGVLTFAMHMFAVHVMLGGAALTIKGALSSDSNWRRLANIMLSTAKVAVSVAVVIGVAPLLFVQVIYDPFWYTSNVLSAWWVIGFILILCVAYLLVYVFYAKNHDFTTAKTRCPGSMILSLALFLVVGLIMHTLTNQMLSPNEWMTWYAPNGQIDASGTQLHSINWARFAFMIILAAPVTGAWLYGYRHYISVRDDSDKEYLDFVASLANKMLNIGGAISIVIGAVWIATLPENQAAFATNPLVYLTALVLVLLTLVPQLLGAKVNKGYAAYWLVAFAFIAIAVVAVDREVIRWVALVIESGYNPMDYPINMDWYSTILFFITFAVVGGMAIGYLLTVAWQAGQTSGTYTPSAAISRLGDWTIYIIIIWIIHYFAVGFWVWAQ